MGDDRALRGLSDFCVGGCDDPGWAIFDACVVVECVWDAGGDRIFCDFGVLHSLAVSRRREARGRSILFAAVHPDLDSAGGCGVRVQIWWDAGAFLGRALDFVGVAAVEFAVRGDLLRGVSVVTAYAASDELGTRGNGGVCDERGGGGDAAARAVLA